MRNSFVHINLICLVCSLMASGCLSKEEVEPGEPRYEEDFEQLTDPLYLNGSLTDTADHTEPKLIYAGLGLYEVTVHTLGRELLHDIGFSTSQAELICGRPYQDSGEWPKESSLSELRDGIKLICGTVEYLLNGSSKKVDRIFIQLEEQGYYKFTLDFYHSKETPVLTVKRQPSDYIPELVDPIYVRGGMQEDWGAVESQKLNYLGDGVYQRQFHIEKGTYSWKVADESWVNTNCGALKWEVDEWPSLFEVTINELKKGFKGYCSSKSPVNITTEFSSGNYIFTIDFSDVAYEPIFTVSRADGD